MCAMANNERPPVPVPQETEERLRELWADTPLNDEPLPGLGPRRSGLAGLRARNQRLHDRILRDLERQQSLERQ